MKKVKIIVILLFLSSTIEGCMDSIDTRDLMVSNGSNKSIYSIISNNDDMFGSGYYDEFRRDEKYVYTKKDSLFRFIFEEIEPNTKYACHDRPSYWETFIESTIDKKIRLFIISKDSVDKYGWNKIFKNQIYNKKYELTIEDLEAMNWKIDYK